MNLVCRIAFQKVKIRLKSWSTILCIQLKFLNQAWGHKEFLSWQKTSLCPQGFEIVLCWFFINETEEWLIWSQLINCLPQNGQFFNIVSIFSLPNNSPSIQFIVRTKKYRIYIVWHARVQRGEKRSNIASFQNTYWSIFRAANLGHFRILIVRNKVTISRPANTTHMKETIGVPSIFDTCHWTFSIQFREWVIHPKIHKVILHGQCKKDRRAIETRSSIKLVYG